MTALDSRTAVLQAVRDNVLTVHENNEVITILLRQARSQPWRVLRSIRSLMRANLLHLKNQELLASCVELLVEEVRS